MTALWVHSQALTFLSFAKGRGSRLAAVCLALVCTGHVATASADVLLFSSADQALETGFWRVQIKRSDWGSDCLGSAAPAKCYFTWMDVQNNSDQSLRCNVSMTVVTAFGTAPEQRSNVPISPREAEAVIVVSSAAAVTAYEANCAAGPPPEGFEEEDPYVPSPSLPAPAPADNTGAVSFTGLPGYISLGMPLGPSDDWSACFYLPEITNTRNVSSGELSLRIFASQQPGADVGYTVISAALGVLPPNTRWTFPQSTHCAKFERYPPNGVYYFSLLLTEGSPNRPRDCR